MIADQHQMGQHQETEAPFYLRNQYFSWKDCGHQFKIPRDPSS